MTVLEWLQDNWGVILSWIIILGLIGVAFVGVWFSAPRLHEGIVIDKFYTPSMTSLVPMNINGKTSFYPAYHSAQYRIKVQGMTGEGEQRVEWWNLEKEMYTTIGIGDYVRRDKSGISIETKGGGTR